MTTERAYKTRAIVLRSRNLGEAHKIHVLFTEARGKVDGVAKGIRRAHSHLAGKLEFASEVELTLHRGRSLDVITGAHIVSSRWDAIAEPGAYAAAALACELVDSFCEHDLAQPEIYALLSGALKALSHTSDPASIVPRFQLRLLGELGLAPPDGTCVRCDRSLEGLPAWADLDSGGLACERCRPHESDRYALEREDVAVFRALAAPRSSGISALRPTLEATPRAARAIDAFIAYHLGKRPKARPLVDELAAGGGSRS